MNDSILDTIKKMLGIDKDYTAFDTDIIIGINSALMTISQLGSVDNGLLIKDSSSTWSEALSDPTKLEAAKSFVFLTVQLAFDPPANSAVIQAKQRMLDEFAWRLTVRKDELTES